MKMYQCLIVEDEPLAQRIIQKHIAQYDYLVVGGTCENALQAFELLNRSKIDLIFLDITLPAINGIDFIRSLKTPPAIIFTTAYSEYAVASYELEAIDYLLKPITFERFHQAIARFRRWRETKGEGIDFVYIKSGGSLIKLSFQDVLMVEARKDYLMLYQSNHRHITHMTMKHLESILPKADFIRIHRSYIVRKEAVNLIGSTHLEIHGRNLRIGETYRNMVLKEFKSLKI